MGYFKKCNHFNKIEIITHYFIGSLEEKILTFGKFMEYKQHYSHKFAQTWHYQITKYTVGSFIVTNSMLLHGKHIYIIGKRVSLMFDDIIRLNLECMYAIISKRKPYKSPSVHMGS